LLWNGFVKGSRGKARAWFDKLTTTWLIVTGNKPAPSLSRGRSKDNEAGACPCESRGTFYGADKEVSWKKKRRIPIRVL
jgi:hypothetical protein